MEDVTWAPIKNPGPNRHSLRVVFQVRQMSVFDPNASLLKQIMLVVLIVRLMSSLLNPLVEEESHRSLSRTDPPTTLHAFVVSMQDDTERRHVFIE